MGLPPLQGICTTGPLELKKIAYKTFLALLVLFKLLTLPDFYSAIVCYLRVAGAQTEDSISKFHPQ